MGADVGIFHGWWTAGWWHGIGRDRLRWRDGRRRPGFWRRIKWIGHDRVRQDGIRHCQVNSEKVQIRGAGFCYEAHIGRGLIEQVGELTREKVRGHRAGVIADSNVPPAIMREVESSLSEAGFQVTKVVVPPGEKSKSLAEVERICGEISHLDRSSVVLGVGGGVTGDLSGFVAAVFHRGVPHVQIPTTLLAMVDSAIGGKTGVNLPAGKNLVGAIHHPAFVLADAAALDTLAQRELRQGYAEMVKHAIISDAEMLRALSSRAQSRDPGEDSSKVALRDPSRLRSAPARQATIPRDDDLVELIARNIRIKAAIVSTDDRDASGERALLNFGHTIGHGIERASDFQIPHGECVSLGIVGACEISVKRAGLSANERDEVVALLDRLELPTRLPGGIAQEGVLEAIVHDKKFEDGYVRFVLTPRLGQAFLSSDVTIDEIRAALAAL